MSLYEENAQLTVDFGSEGMSTAFVKGDIQPSKFKKATTPKKTHLMKAANQARAARAESEHPLHPAHSFKPKINKVSEELAAGLNSNNVSVGDRVYHRGMQIKAKKAKEVERAHHRR